MVCTFIILLIDSPATNRTSASLSSQDTSKSSIAKVKSLGNSLISLKRIVRKVIIFDIKFSKIRRR